MIYLILSILYSILQEEEIRKATYTLLNFTSDNAINGKDFIPRELLANAKGTFILAFSTFVIFYFLYLLFLLSYFLLFLSHYLFFIFSFLVSISPFLLSVFTLISVFPLLLSLFCFCYYTHFF